MRTEKDTQLLFIDLAIGKAVSDYKYGNVNRKGHPFGTPERDAYNDKIDELKGVDYELEQRDSALSIEKGEDV